MKKLNPLFTTLAAAAGLLSLEACSNPVDANSPPPYVIVSPPAWTDAIQVQDVGPRRARIKNTFGQSVVVTRKMTFLDTGLMAYTGNSHVRVTDMQGVICEWNNEPRLENCRTGNPAYNDYMSFKARGIRF